MFDGMQSEVRNNEGAIDGWKSQDQGGLKLSIFKTTDTQFLQKESTDDSVFHVLRRGI